MRRSAFTSKRLLPALLALPLLLAGCFTELTSTSCENDYHCFRHEAEVCRADTCSRFRLSPIPDSHFVWGRVISANRDAQGNDVPIPTANVCGPLLGSSPVFGIDSEGSFFIHVDPNQERLRANAPGYSLKTGINITGYVNPPGQTQPSFRIIKLEPCSGPGCNSDDCGVSL